MAVEKMLFTLAEYTTYIIIHIFGKGVFESTLRLRFRGATLRCANNQFLESITVNHLSIPAGGNTVMYLGPVHKAPYTPAV